MLNATVGRRKRSKSHFRVERGLDA